MMPTPRRKKWSEAEERTLIERYGEVVSDGTLAKMKTREKKYRPIALYVNSVHHVRDPVLYPWQWTWKDVSTKVQNMRHQYLLVKQKIRKAKERPVGVDSGEDEFEWDDGVSHWSNFLRYKQVFGDVPLVFTSNGSMLVGALRDDDRRGTGLDVSDRGIEIQDFGHFSQSCDEDYRAGIDCGENGVLGMGFEYDGEEGEENYNDSSHLKEDGNKAALVEGMEKKGFDFLASQLAQLSEMEKQFEHNELEQESERQRREHLRSEREKESERMLEEREKERAEREKSKEGLKKRRILEWESMEDENQERERRRRENMVIQEREWEERMNMRRSEWKKRMDNMLTEHREEMAQLQSRILHEQQHMVSQLLGIVSQWTGHPVSLTDHTGASGHYLPQTMQNLHHVNEVVHDDTRVEEDNQEDQFIVNG